MSEGLFGALYARGGAAESLSDTAWLAAMLEVEAALARACAREGQIPPEAAEAIAAACDPERFDQIPAEAAEAGNPERFDLAAVGRGVAASGTPVVALVAALREAVGDEIARHVHRGATSQDIVDTAAMLVARRALGHVLSDAAAVAAAAARLADAHRATPMAGRTLLQLALPTTFGLRAAGWLVGLDEARARLRSVRDRELAVQMGGPVGSRAPAIATRVADELGLAEPVIPWHAIRVRPATLAGALGGLAGVAAKIARDVTLLAQDEIGELSEGDDPDRGRSSAMAHKRNPVASVAVLACTARIPGLVGTMHATMAQEHERGAGGWQAEWGTLTDLLTLTGSACAWLSDLMERLEVRPDRMRENLGRLEAEHSVDDANVLIDRALAAHLASEDGR